MTTTDKCHPEIPKSNKINDWHGDTYLVHGQLAWQPRPGFVSLSTPVHRASTVLFDSCAAFYRRHDQTGEAWVYGTVGTPTTKTLEHQISLSEAGHCEQADTCLTPSGLAAVTLVYLSLLSAGDHVLVPNNVYDPSRFFASSFCKRMGIETSFYDPLDLAVLAEKFQSNTRLIWVESPGSLTFEVADLPAIATLARQQNAYVAIDNTWSGGMFFKAFQFGADVSVQALTKYHGGHGDLVMGSVTCLDSALAQQVRHTRDTLGIAVSGDDCALILRGMQTMALRLRYLETATLEVARWLSTRSEVARVLHPALPDCPGHAVWKRDFSGSSSVFSFEFAPHYSAQQRDVFVDALRLFGIGASWGGTASLALPINPNKTRMLTASKAFAGPLVRLNIGLEHIPDLLADLEQAMDSLQKTS